MSLALLLIAAPLIVFSAKLPANLLISPKAGPHHVILVDKASQRLSIYEFDGDYRLVASYGCATGENPGDKKVSGDRKTPEGIYYFTKAVEEKYLSSTYGARAFPMNYPNLLDRRWNKDGNGIWVHGTNEELAERSTNGCVAMANEDIVSLDSYIELWDTPIIIEEELKYEDSSKLRAEGRLLLKKIETWRQAWSNKDLDSYLSFYSSDFRWKNLGLKRWRQRKKRLNRLYSAISVQLSDIRFFRHGKNVTASFQEIYRSDKFASHGFKRLHLVQNSEEWRILGEEWRKSTRPVPPPLRLAAKPPSPPESGQVSLQGFIQKWQSAWERGDLSAYVDCYHPNFRSRGMDLEDWKRYKERLFEGSSRRSVRLNDMNTKVDGSAATVVFKQRYRTEGFQDYGLKTLRLKKHKGEWTILREDWEALPDQG